MKYLENNIYCSLFVGREGERKSVHQYRTEGRTREDTRCGMPEVRFADNDELSVV